MTSKTSDHYSYQWGSGPAFGDFVEKNPEAAMVMPGRQLPWDALIASLRAKAADQPVRVYDAGCGFGDLMRRVMAPPSLAGLSYLGADIHGALGDIATLEGAELIRHDMALPTGRAPFDAILCRAAIHHTPDPPATYRALASQLAPGGVLAISAYARKAPMREAVDDALRARIVPMSNGDAMMAAHQITALGKALQACDGMIDIPIDLPFLDIKAGHYKVQDFIYRHFMKCWHNVGFSPEHSDLVNFDWYHPPYAFRYSMDELEAWATDAGLSVRLRTSTEAQHYVEAVRPPLD